MHIVIVTDAWYPQVNGVVRTLDSLGRHLTARNHEVTYITPNEFRTTPCPTYPEIRLALFPGPKVKKLLDTAQPCAIHLATEGPLGLAARRYCRRRGLPFTTAYHTRFPEYIHARTRLPLAWSYAFVRWFHGASSGVMVATETIEQALEERGFKDIRRWTRGVDTDQFRPQYRNSPPKELQGIEGPIQLYVGRVAVEKNIEAFLSLGNPGQKVVVGDGPQLESLRKAHPDVLFAGARHGADLAAWYAAADVFVFPSRTDTFGLVLIEALASGVPVAAYPVPGPLDVIGDSPAGVLDENLELAVEKALGIPADVCRAHAETFSWAVSTQQFIDNLSPFRDEAGDYTMIPTDMVAAGSSASDS
ncbi:glycosyltransferase family 1 protein [Magnetospira sp. QH-2]|uniref:glycosyltransferase family 4 protein n=1 Tax=Magnetospira sp. (strain QH-2) TaxID=1288970 RepID=UPI0003E81757|nr:glycosyltransferase family 1 protein [Magnetospira sp. QH-2]CCQ74663.1 putative GT4 : distantly related to 1, 2-diacylglycerol 3-glucosyltransferase [Magnetospira sp. QH-2]